MPPEKIPEEVRSLMAALQAWCKEGRGRQVELAKSIDVNPQLLSNWLNTRKTPSLANWLKLTDFARKKRISR